MLPACSWRAARRRREIGIRLALGARTARLVRMLVSESLVLGLAGGAVGLLLALWAARLFSSWRLAMELPVSFAVDLDGRVLALTVGVTLATALLFGLLPAVQIARPRLAMAMREGGGDADPRRARWRGALVTAQIAVTFLLLAGAGLFFRSLANARTVDLGFRAARVALYDLKPMTEQLQLPLLPERLAGTLLAAMGTLALVLALVGLYAATAFALARRTREIGIRMALGAGQRSVIALVLRGGMTQCLLGIGIGALAAVATTRFAASLLYGVSPTDPAILAATALLVAALALAANLVPALGATQIDPKQALGAE